MKQTNKNFYSVVIVALVILAAGFFAWNFKSKSSPEASMAEMRHLLKLHDDNIRILNEQITYMNKQLQDTRSQLEAQKKVSAREASRNEVPPAKGSGSRFDRRKLK